VLTHNSSTRQLPILVLLLHRQCTTSGFFLRRLALVVPLLYALVASIGSTLALGLDGDLAPLDQFEIVLTSLPDGKTDNFTGLLGDDSWRFLGVAFLLSALGLPLFFCGRSTGLSATSITMTSNPASLAHNFSLLAWIFHK
jgi:hypothetical protein